MYSTAQEEISVIGDRTLRHSDCGGEDVSLFRASKIALGTKAEGDVADWEMALCALRGGIGIKSRIR